MNDDLLPSNSTKLERSLSRSIARIDSIPVRFKEIWNPDTCPVEFLPWLAWSLSIDRWEDDWTETQKRAVIKNSSFIHRHKGTFGGLKRAFESLGYQVRITEWFERTPKGAPYTFQVDVTIPNTGISEKLYTDLEQVVLDFKNVRSFMEKMTLAGVTKGSMRCACGVTDGIHTTVLPYIEVELESFCLTKYQGAEYTADTVTLMRN